MAHDVFICHSAKDKTTAAAVCAMLESNGVRCWIAPRDVTPGMEWSECIIDAIEECRVMVLVFTTNANESSQIRREIERAVNRGVAILPIRIEDILPARALEYFIGNVHWLDALTPPLESHIQNLAGTVKILLGRLPQHAPIPNPTLIPSIVDAPAAPGIEWTAPAHRPVNEPRAREIFPERVDRRIETPQVIPAPPKIEWSEPAHPPVAEPTPPEIFREPVARPIEASQTPPPVQPPVSVPFSSAQAVRQQTWEVRASTDAGPASKAPTVPIETVAAEKVKRPTAVTVIALLHFLFAVLMVLEYSAESIRAREEHGMWLMLLAPVAGIAGYGLLKLEKWGRFLGIALSTIGVIWLINSYREVTDGVAGIIFMLVLFAIFGGVDFYLFTPKGKLAFRKIG